MSEFADLSSDEIRMLRERRAQMAIETRPVDKPVALGQLLTAMRSLAAVGLQLDPNVALWQAIIELIPGD